jgi:hypothetical protein
LIIQAPTRSKLTNHSKEDAAKILFRDHHGCGTGPDWLVEYLRGISVDRARCIAISDAAGPSKLRVAMESI